MFVHHKGLIKSESVGTKDMSTTLNECGIIMEESKNSERGISDEWIILVIIKSEVVKKTAASSETKKRLH